MLVNKRFSSKFSPQHLSFSLKSSLNSEKRLYTPTFASNTEHNVFVFLLVPVFIVQNFVLINLSDRNILPVRVCSCTAAGAVFLFATQTEKVFCENWNDIK